MSDRGEGGFYFYSTAPNNASYFFSFPPEVKSFDEYVEGWDNFVSVTTNRLDELRDNYLLVIQSSSISS